MSQEKIKVLIIEDSELDLLIYRELLEGSDMLLFEATSFEQAKSMFLARMPDVVVIDYNLTGIYAPEVIKKLNKLSPENRFCSIVVTSFGSEDTVKNSLKAGAKDYLSKDELTKELLVNTIKSAYQNFKEESIVFEEQDKLATALAKANSLMEENNKFLASVTHELRTPLNGIIGFLGLLTEKNLKKEKQEEYINLANLSASHLLNLVNDLLDLSKIKANKLEIELVKFNLADVITNSCSICSTQMEAKDIVLAIDIGESLSDSYYGDANRLQQIFINLISNAIKFTPKRGAILITAMRNKENSNSYKDEVAFSISDTGIGIPKDKVDKIFSPFSQAESSIGREYGGTGLGLSIVTNLVRLMNGSIWVESMEGVGSSFKFFIDLEKATKPKTNDMKVREDNLSQNSKHVLLAEDNEINQKLFKIVLEKMGHVVNVVDNGKKALDFLENNEVDIVFMDIQMPEMGGLEATVEIRKIEKRNGSKRVPIVAVTANAVEYEDGRYEKAGMDQVLAKPIDNNKVEVAIKKYCG